MTRDYRKSHSPSDTPIESRLSNRREKASEPVAVLQAMLTVMPSSSSTDDALSALHSVYAADTEPGSESTADTLLQSAARVPVLAPGALVHRNSFEEVNIAGHALVKQAVFRSSEPLTHEPKALSEVVSPIPRAVSVESEPSITNNEEQVPALVNAAPMPDIPPAAVVDVMAVQAPATSPATSSTELTTASVTDNSTSVTYAAAITSPTEAQEVAFIDGVNANGTVAATSFDTWNGDEPATYSTVSTATKWGTSHTAGTPGGTETYYFDPASDWTPTEETALAAGLALWSAVANIQFVQTTTASGAGLTFYRNSSGGTGEAAPNGGSTRVGRTRLASQGSGAYITINTSTYGWEQLGSFSYAGGYAVETVVHEEGHFLGFGHAGPYNGSVDGTQQYSAYDTRLWSIMSYIDPTETDTTYYSQYPVTGTNWDGNYATTWMPLDILAAQALYGTATNTPLSGGQVFGFDTNITGLIQPFFDFTQNTNPVITLWDSGSNNTLNLSGYSSTDTINLNAGSFSSFDGMTNNLAIAYNTAIDNLIGGSGNDTVFANSGSDYVDGEGGFNDVVFSGARASYEVASAGGSITVTDITNGVADTLVNVTELTFSDQSLFLGVIVSDGQTSAVTSDQVYSGTLVENGGVLNLSSGGIASSTVDSGFINVSSGGTAIAMAVSSGGYVVVSSGGVLSGGISDSGGSELVQTGGTTVGAVISGGTLSLQTGATVTGGIAFSGLSGTLDIVGTVMPLAVISGFVSGAADTIELTGVGYASGGTAAISGGALNVTEGGATYTLNLTGDYTSQYFHLGSDSTGDTIITVDGTPCYCRGTLILTDRGDVPVERLMIGDRLVTKSDYAKPIRWIGKRSYNGRFARMNKKVMPVRIRPGALGQGLPKRSLYVSPEHAMFIDGVLVPAIALVNAISIEQTQIPTEQVEYFHLELNAHDVIYAEGAPSETFVDDGSRGMFINAHEYRTLYPDAPRTAELYCAPRVEDGEELYVIRQRLHKIAGQTVRSKQDARAG